MKVSDQVDAGHLLSCRVRLRVLLVVSGIAVFYGLGFGVRHWLNGLIQPAVVNFVVSALLSVNAIVALKRPDCRIPRFCMVFISTLFFLYLFAIGIAGDGAAMWGLIVPIASFFLAEFKAGLITSLFYLCGCIVCSWLSGLYPEWFHVYQPIFLNRFIGIYAMIFMVSGGYEYCRGKNEAALIDLLNDTRRVQLLVAESEAKYRALFDGSGHGIIVSRSDDEQIIEANPTATKMFDFNADELLQKRVGSLYERSAEVATKAFSSEKNGREVWQAGNLVCHRRDGNQFYADLFVTRIKPGDLDYTVYFFTDVTERMLKELELKNAREKACAASEAKSNFLANISHEIRTPLNGIIGVADLLSDTPLNQDQQEYVKIICTSGGTLLHLVDDVLDLSSIEAGRTGLKLESFAAAPFFEEISTEIRLQALQKGLIFDFDLAGAPLHIYGDRLRIRQVLNNLLGNAVKFTDSGGWVGLNVTFEGDAAGGLGQFMRAEVSDTGIGIAPADIDKLFQDFNQVDSSRTRKYGGTGLGLSISRRLVAMMGGEIGVESAPGRGSKFWFRVSVVPGSHADMKESGVPCGTLCA